MSKFFIEHPAAFAMLAQAADKSPKALAEAFQPLVAAFVFESVEAGVAAFNAAKAEALSALLVSQRAEALEAATAMLKGVTFSKSLTGKLVEALKAATVLDPETGEPNPVRVVLTLDETGEALSVALRGYAAKAGRASKGSKALLDGKPLTNALLRTDYADSYAAKVLADPHGTDPERYKSPKTRLNATQAVKADPVLKGRLTYTS